MNKKQCLFSIFAVVCLFSSSSFLSAQKIIKHTGQSSALSQKMVWAQQQAEARVWIAWSFETMMPENRFVATSFIMRSGKTKISGTIHGTFGANMLEDLFEDRNLKSIYEMVYDRKPENWLTNFNDEESVKQAARRALKKDALKRPSEIVMFLGFDRSKNAFDAVEYRSINLPFDYNRRPILWLGKHAEEESATMLRALYDRIEAQQGKENILEAAALHKKSESAFALLENTLRNDGDWKLREEAASSLGRFQHECAVKALTFAIENDASEKVRVEAVEALADQENDEAFEVLKGILQKGGSRRVQNEALEAISDGFPQRAESVLYDVAMNNPEESLQREAVEAIGDLKYEVAAPSLKHILSEHKSPRVRSEAVERLADLASPKMMIPVLENVAANDPSRTVRAQALESLVEDLGELGVEAAVRIARTHENLDVRKQAINALGDSDNRTARNALIHLISK